MHYLNHNNDSFGIIFHAVLFTWPPIYSVIKQRDMTKQFQEKAIQFHGIFDGLKFTN